MTRADLPPSLDPELHQLQQLVRRGTDELDQLDPAQAGRLQRRIEDEAFGDGGSDGGDTSTARRPAGWLPLALAAALALVVGVGIGTTLTGGDGADDATTLATVELAPLVDGVVAHSASLREGAEGRTIRLDLAELPETEGFHEVWLLDPDSGALVSLGPVRADDTYAVPDTVDVVDLSLLDVSDEPRDGDPAHSGDSLLRGEIRWTG